MNQRLTKRLFMILPANLFLVSNCYMGRPDGSYAPCFKEIVLPTLVERKDQWKRIVKAGAAQRLCYIYKSEEDYKIHLLDPRAPVEVKCTTRRPGRVKLYLAKS